jgi:hypothetical protein
MPMTRIVGGTKRPWGVQKEALDRLGWAHGDPDWELWLPSTGEPVEKALAGLRPPRPDAVIGAVPECRHFSNKRRLWHALVRARGREVAKAVMPETFLPEVPADLREMQAQGGPWIVKNARLQRRRGIHLVEKFDEAMALVGGEGDWLIQHRLLDLLTVANHRCNLRAYLVVVREADAVTASLHRWGPVVYASAPVSDGGFDAWITLSQPDWPGPPGAPLDLPSLLSTLTAAGFDPSPVLRGMGRAMRAAVGAVAPLIAASGTLRAHRCFELFGVDFAIDREFRPWLLEVNRQPMMEPRFDGERAQRLDVISDALACAGLVEGGGAFIEVGRWGRPHSSQNALIDPGHLNTNENH